MALPTLKCSSETRPLTKGQRQKTERAEQECGRNVAGYALKDQLRNAVITNELNIFNLSNMIRNNRVNYLHCVERMEAERLPKQLMDYAP
jgi:hypothetical protein